MTKRLKFVFWTGTATALVFLSTWQRWPWYATAIALFAMGTYLFMSAYESMAQDPKYIAFIATMSAISAVSRTAVQGIPGVQPATFFVIMTGYSFGPAAGAAVGAFTALGSNVFLGEGGWTPWQMLAWGLVGATAGLLRKVKPNFSRTWLVPFGFVWGYLFGWIMNTWVLIGGTTLTVATYFLLDAASFWMDTLHALATALLLTVAGRGVHTILERFRVRMQVTRLDEKDGIKRINQFEL